MIRQSYGPRFRLMAVPPRLALMIALLACSYQTGSAQAADLQWANAAGGSWSDPTNWSPAQVPSQGDRAFVALPGSYTVTVAVGDAPSIDELSVGGPTGMQTLVLESNAAVSVLGSVHVGASGIIRLETAAGFKANGVIQNLGQIVAASADIQADLGLENTGLLDLSDSRVSGGVTNRGRTRTTALVFFQTFHNEPGGALEVLTGAGASSGAGMDTLLNRGHVDVRGAAHLVAQGLLSNEPFAVVSLADSAVSYSLLTINAGVIRVAVNAHVVGDYQQLPSGELEPHYSASAQSFCITGQSATLDGTLSPIFEGGFQPPTGNLPLIFSTTTSGQFAIVNQAGTGGIRVQPLYVGYVYLRVFGTALAIYPSSGGDLGLLSTLISGSRFTSVVAARLRRTGENDIVAVSVSRDPKTDLISARFDLTGATHGTWDVVVADPNDAIETAAGVFTIEAVIQEPVRVAIYGRDRLRLGSSSDWSVSITNPGNVDAIGALQLSLPGGLGWELSVRRPGATVASGVAGHFVQATPLVIPDFVLPPGMSLTGLKVRLTAPESGPVPSVTLQARWFQE